MEWIEEDEWYMHDDDDPPCYKYDWTCCSSLRDPKTSEDIREKTKATLSWEEGFLIIPLMYVTAEGFVSQQAKPY